VKLAFYLAIKMKLFASSLLLALGLITPNSLYSEQSFGNYEGAVYVRNYDGDTITFNLPKLHPIIGKKISIRVDGIDTPEIKGKCEKEKYEAQQTRDMVADILMDAEQITLKNMKRGKYFRIVADVIVDGENLSDMLIEAGVAIKYSGKKKIHQWCEE
jgi:endonuclease YncB( thermonuclease family)